MQMMMIYLVFKVAKMKDSKSFITWCHDFQNIPIMGHAMQNTPIR